MKKIDLDLKRGLDLPMNDPIKIAELMLKLIDKQFALKHVGITPRVHNAWRSAGLIPYAEAEGKWVKYDFVQYIWLQMVKDLREFGVPIEKLLVFKDSLFSDLAKFDLVISDEQAKFMESEYSSRFGLPGKDKVLTNENYERAKLAVQNMLNGFLLNHFFFRANTVFYFYQDGQVEVWSNYQEQIAPELKPTLDQPYIALPLQHYISKFLSDETKAEFLTTIPILSHEEKEVLQAMRNQQLKEISIKFIQDGKGRRIDIVTKADGLLTEEQTKQITQILGLGNYQNISLKKQNGSKLYFEREKRQKL